MAVVAGAPSALALQCMNKLRPLLSPDSGVFTEENVEELVLRLQSASTHDGAAVQLPPAEEAALRHDLLTAAVLISAID